MARGYSDFFGQSIFFRFGTFTRVDAAVVVDANVETPIIALAGKGQLYHGFMGVSGAIHCGDSEVRLYVDGLLVYSPRVRSLYENNETLPCDFDFWMTRYDLRIFEYSIQLGGSFSFEQNCALRYFETAGDTPTVTGELDYAVQT